MRARLLRRATAIWAILAIVGWLVIKLRRRRQLAHLPAPAPEPEVAEAEATAAAPQADNPPPQQITRDCGSSLATRSSASSAIPVTRVAAIPGRLFLSYRADADAELVEKLHDKLRLLGVDVWWDRASLVPGQPWEDGFADGLFSADVFVPVLSKRALAPFAALQSDSRCDNVLLEYRLANELKARDELRAIFPVLVGEPVVSKDLGEGFGCFFKGGGLPQAPEVLVQRVEAKVAEHLQRGGRGSSVSSLSNCTVKGVLEGICKHQGVFLRGVPKADAVEKVVNALAQVSGEGLAAEKSVASSSPTTRPLALQGGLAPPLPEGKKFSAFLSHYKAECSMEARFVQEKLESVLGHVLFLDSDRLIDLQKIKQHVRESSVLLLLQSKSVFTRPYCLLELATALSEGVPVVCLAMVGGTAHYDFEQGLKLLTYLDTKLEQANPGAGELLKAEGWDLTDLAHLLATSIPSRVSIPFQAGASRNALAASLDDVVQTIRLAKAADLDDLPQKEHWLAHRGRSRSFPQHGSVAASIVQSSSHSLAAIPLEVPTLPPNAVERPELIEQLLNRVLQRGAGGEASATAITAPARRSGPRAQHQKLSSNMTSANGMGGVGKTMIASAFVRDDLVRAAFQKLCWVSVGQEPDILALQQGLHRQLVARPLPETAAADEKLALTALKEAAAKDTSVLLVLDDVWSPEHAKLLNFVDPSAPSSAVLVTTRIRSLLGDDATEVQCEVLSKEAALQLLLRAGGVEHLLEDRVPDAALEAVEACFRLPLTLSIAGAIISELRDSWQQDLVPMLQTEFDDESVEQRVVMASLSVVPEAMRAGVGDLFMLFAVFAEDASVPAAAIDALAPLMPSASGKARKREVRRWLGQLLKANILCGSVEEGVSVHDLVRDCMIHRVEAEREGGLRALQREAVPLLLAEVDSHGPAAGYVSVNLQAHVRGSQQPDVALQMDALLMQVLSHDHDGIRRQGALGVGEGALREAADACDAAGEHLSSAQLMFAAGSGRATDAGAKARRAWESLRRLEQAGQGSSTSRTLEMSVAHTLTNQWNTGGYSSDSPEFKVVLQRIAELGERTQEGSGVTKELSRKEVMEAQNALAMKAAIETCRLEGILGVRSRPMTQELLMESYELQCQTWVHSQNAAAADPHNGQLFGASVGLCGINMGPFLFPRAHRLPDYDRDFFCGQSGALLRDWIEMYTFETSHAPLKTVGIRGDTFMIGCPAIGLLLWWGDLTAVSASVTKMLDAHAKVLALVQQGDASPASYAYETTFPCYWFVSLLLAAHELDALREFLANSLLGAAATDAAVRPSKSFAKPTADGEHSPLTEETWVLTVRGLTMLVEEDTEASRTALRAWLPPPAELLRIAEYECGWRGRAIGAGHPALLCALLHGERLGDWAVAEEVAEGVLAIEQFNPFLRVDAHRLVGRARAALGRRAAACEAAEAAAAEAVGARYAWFEMLAVRDLLRWSEEGEAERVVRARLDGVVGRLMATPEQLAGVLGE